MPRDTSPGPYAPGIGPADALPRIGIREDLAEMNLDDMILHLKTRTLILSAMAFQDAMNLNLERLYRCSLHVYQDGKLVPFCYRYMERPEI